MKFLSILSALIALTLFGLWTWSNHPEAKNVAASFINGKRFNTLEIRHTAEKIMEVHKKDLLKDENHIYLNPDTQFHPYLLMEVKFSSSSSKTGEGIILWSMVDGEMVLDTGNWEKTHGFTDCIKASADKDDFKVINALASKGGSIDREALAHGLNVENEVLDKWVDNCRRKNLIVQSGNVYRLHFRDPKIRVLPRTKLEEWLVTKPIKNTTRLSKNFRASQIETIARLAFGTDFAIRKTTEVFLPVHTIVVQNPDGSQMTSYWNALNGKRLPTPYPIE